MIIRLLEGPGYIADVLASAIPSGALNMDQPSADLFELIKKSLIGYSCNLFIVVDLKAWLYRCTLNIFYANRPHMDRRS
jgi:hypothetical protein